MRILLQTKDQNAPVLGIASFANNLIGDAFTGESAWDYSLSGYDITVGYYNNIAKYAAFVKEDGTPLAPSDIHSLLEFIGPISNWQPSVPSTPTPAVTPAPASGGTQTVTSKSSGKSSQGGAMPTAPAPAATTPSPDYIYHEEGSDGTSYDATAFTSKGYLFAYVPTILVNRAALDSEMPG